jgi:hypothetical protein
MQFLLLAIVLTFVSFIVAVEPGTAGAPLINLNRGVGYHKAHTPMPSSHTTEATIDNTWKHSRDGPYMHNLKKQLLSGLKREKDAMKDPKVKGLLEDKVALQKDRDEHDSRWKSWGTKHHFKRLDKLQDMQDKIRESMSTAKADECIDCHFKGESDPTEYTA